MFEAYQLFAEVENMPAAYGFLRVRLRFEQSRLLRWGERIGLAEELLDKPSRVLQLNRNLIFDMLLEIQGLFKQTVKIQAKFDSLIPEKALPVHDTQPALQISENHFLKKTLKVFNKLPQAPQRLQWAFIKQNEFKGLIEKLIGYNDAIEGLLEFGAVEQLLDSQRQTYMAILQLNSKVDHLQQISLAMQVQTTLPANEVSQNNLSIIRKQENQDLADLASFKAQESLVEKETTAVQPLSAAEISFLGDDDSTRCEAIFGSQRVWIEWKEYDSDHENPAWGAIITQRVKNLVTLLASPRKSPYFRVPNCLGYFTTLGESPNITRYGLVYQKPHDISPETPYTTLYSQFIHQPKPSLTQRITLAHTIARSLMYLHSVNWLHKSFRSNNILFFLPLSLPPSQIGKQAYHNPIISGFEYSRLDLVDEYTELVPSHSENDIYRHPRTLSSLHLRSKKSYDIYSLGIVLIEIAYWQRIQDIVHLPEDEKRAKKMIRRLRESLLSEERVLELGGLVGDSYSQAVIACLEGLVGLEVDEENPLVGIEIQGAFYDRVVARLSSVKI